MAIVLAILAPFIARLVQMSISRQREYLADASGVELTRNPVGLEQALAKIALDTEPLEVANRATQHLYFENPIKAADGRSSNLFSTHPPVMDRINRLRALQGQPPIQNPELVLGLARADPPARPAGAPRAVGSTGDRGVAARRPRPLRRRAPSPCRSFGVRGILRPADGPPRGPGTGPR